MIRDHPGSTLFPYTTLFRSRVHRAWLAEALQTNSRNYELPCGQFPCTPHKQLSVASRSQTVPQGFHRRDRKSTRLNSSHLGISYAVFCLKKKNNDNTDERPL